MGRAEDIYRRIVEGGVETIHGFVRDRESESLFLDFKRSRDGGVNGRLHDHDRNSLAKAISGFGNSEGGVIVWGVECSKKDKGDVASELIPIGDVKRFVSLIEGAVSGCTLPPCSLVENKVVVNDSEDRGFVVTYVPKSNDAPHQVVGDYKYYMRAGSSFSPVPHGVLAGMFGRRPQANVSLGINVATPHDFNAVISFSFVVSICNNGPGIAYDPYFNMEFIEMPPTNELKINYKVASQEIWGVSNNMQSVVSAMSKYRFRMAPKSVCPVLDGEFHVLSKVTQGIAIAMQAGFGSSAPISNSWINSAENLNSLIHEYFEYKKRRVYERESVDNWGSRFLGGRQ